MHNLSLSNNLLIELLFHGVLAISFGCVYGILQRLQSLFQTVFNDFIIINIKI